MRPCVYVPPSPIEVSSLFTHDAAWYQVDLTSVLADSANCVAVALFGWKDVTTPALHQWGVDQDSWTCPPWLFALHSRGRGHAVARLDSNKKVWLYATNDDVRVFLTAEFYSPGFVAYDDPIDHTPATGGQANLWRVIVTGEGSLQGGDDGRDVEATVVQCRTVQAVGSNWNTRSYGSSTSDLYLTDLDWSAHWIPQHAVAAFVSGSWYAVYEQYSSGFVNGKDVSPYQNVYEVGYVRKDSGYYSFFDPVDVPISTLSAWTTIEAPADVPSNADALFARLHNPQATGYITCGLRAVGQSDVENDIEKPLHNTALGARLDSSRQFQYYSNSANLEIQIHGYSFPGVIVEGDSTVAVEGGGDVYRVLDGEGLAKVDAEADAYRILDGLAVARIVAEGRTYFPFDGVEATAAALPAVFCSAEAVAAAFAEGRVYPAAVASAEFAPAARAFVSVSSAVEATARAAPPE